MISIQSAEEAGGLDLDKCCVVVWRQQRALRSEAKVTPIDTHVQYTRCVRMHAFSAHRLAAKGYCILLERLPASPTASCDLKLIFVSFLLGFFSVE